jgi:hypothetical protein
MREVGFLSLYACPSSRNGVAYYQLTDKGLMASADISGTKYWKNDDLNK